MIKGPLLKVAALLATILIVLSFAVALMPEYIETIGIVAGVVAVAAVIVLVAMLIRMRQA